MVAYSIRKLQRLLKIDFIRFCIVGGTGFVINFCLLALLAGAFELSVFVAQLIGAEIALFSNFVLHHNWTYRESNVQKTVPQLLLQFHATTWPAIIGSTLMVSAGVSLAHMDKFVALIISSAVALLWNFGWSKFVIWRAVGPKEIEEIAS